MNNHTVTMRTKRNRQPVEEPPPRRPFVWEDLPTLEGTLFDTGSDVYHQYIQTVAADERAIKPRIIMTQAEVDFLSSLFKNKVTLTITLTDAEYALQRAMLEGMAGRGWIDLLAGHKVKLAGRLHARLDGDEFVGREGNEWHYNNLILEVRDDINSLGHTRGDQP